MTTKWTEGDPLLTHRLAEHARHQGDLLRAALWSLIETVEATGGVVQGAQGITVPLADEDWTDLGEVYLAACRALDHEPRVETTEDSLADNLEEEPL